MTMDDRDERSYLYPVRASEQWAVEVQTHMGEQYRRAGRTYKSFRQASAAARRFVKNPDRPPFARTAARVVRTFEVSITEATYFTRSKEADDE